MSNQPLTTLAQAVASHIPDGTRLCVGLSGTRFSHAAWASELIRQQRREITLIAPVIDASLDALFSEGCVQTVITAQAAAQGQALLGFRRVVEANQPNPVEVRDHSIATFALALLGGSLGVPFIPTYTALGSELSSTNTDLVERINPLNERGEPLLLVRAITPDVTILHVDRASEDGRTALAAPVSLAREGAQAARRVLVIATELVPRDAIAVHECIVPPPSITALIVSSARDSLGGDE